MGDIGSVYLASLISAVISQPTQRSIFAKLVPLAVKWVYGKCGILLRPSQGRLVRVRFQYKRRIGRLPEFLPNSEGGYRVKKTASIYNGRSIKKRRDTERDIRDKTPKPPTDRRSFKMAAILRKADLPHQEDSAYIRNLRKSGETATKCLERVAPFRHSKTRKYSVSEELGY